MESCNHGPHTRPSGVPDLARSVHAFPCPIRDRILYDRMGNESDRGGQSNFRETGRLIGFLKVAEEMQFNRLVRARRKRTNTAGELAEARTRVARLYALDRIPQFGVLLSGPGQHLKP